MNLACQHCTLLTIGNEQTATLKTSWEREPSGDKTDRTASELPDTEIKSNQWGYKCAIHAGHGGSKLHYSCIQTATVRHSNL